MPMCWRSLTLRNVQPSSRPRGKGRLLLAVLMATVGIGATTIVSPSIAFAYSCSAHCYGRNGWNAGNFTSWHGATTAVKVVQLTCGSGCGQIGVGETGFVDNEM